MVDKLKNTKINLSWKEKKFLSEKNDQLRKHRSNVINDPEFVSDIKKQGKAPKDFFDEIIGEKIGLNNFLR